MRELMVQKLNTFLVLTRPTIRSERSGIVRQQTGRWHRRQQFIWGRSSELPEGTVRLVVSYFHWIWVHTRKGNTAAERAGERLHPKEIGTTCATYLHFADALPFFPSSIFHLPSSLLPAPCSLLPKTQTFVPHS